MKIIKHRSSDNKMEFMLAVVVAMLTIIPLLRVALATPVPVLTGFASPVRYHTLLRTGEARRLHLWILMHRHEPPIVVFVIISLTHFRKTVHAKIVLAFARITFKVLFLQTVFLA